MIRLILIGFAVLVLIPAAVIAVVSGLPLAVLVAATEPAFCTSGLTAC